MSSGMFRGKESSNRIKLSRLVQDLLNFGVLGSLQLWGGGRWLEGCQGHLRAWESVPHTCTCMHMHMHICTFIHVVKLQMAADMEASMISMFNMHVHVCMCACVYVCIGYFSHTSIPTPTPIHPSATPPGGWTPKISKNSITLELIKIFQFRLKI